MAGNEPPVNRAGDNGFASDGVQLTTVRGCCLTIRYDSRDVPGGSPSLKPSFPVPDRTTGTPLGSSVGDISEPGGA